MTALIICSLFIFPVKQAYASDVSIDVNIPIKHEFILPDTNSNSVNTTGIYMLEAISPNTPMPKDCQGQTYEFKLNGKQTKSNLSMNYTHGGAYEYKLHQITSAKEYYTYDSAEYFITVYIKNTENGKLFPQIVVKNEQGEKSTEVVFKNIYTLKQQNRNNNSYSPETGNAVNLYAIELTLACSLLILFTLKNKKLI